MRAELLRFLIVGTTTVVIDFLVYQLLLHARVEHVALAKASGFVAGTLFAYFANRFWTFSEGVNVAGSVWRFVVLYTLTLAINILVNALSLSFLADGHTSVVAAFVLATGISAVLNFLGMKHFVFKSTANTRST